MGLAVTNARPAIAPTFSTEPMLGTIPIAFAAPSDMDYPFCFDGATSITQRGKIEVLARAEKPASEGWVIDDQGQLMSDPERILQDMDRAAAALLPLGGAGEEFAGYKGYDLAAMVEILSASLCGGMFLKDLLGFAEDGSRRPYMLGHFFLAIDVEHFIPLEVSRRITGRIMRALQASRKAPGQERIYVAGEKEHEMEALVRERGIPVNQNLRQELQTMRDELGITGYDLLIDFDEGLLEVLQVVEGDLPEGYAGETFLYWTTEGTASDAVLIHGAFLGGSVDGPGSLVRIEFRALAPGTSPVSFAEVEVRLFLATPADPGCIGADRTQFAPVGDQQPLPVLVNPHGFLVDRANTKPVWR